MAFCCQLALGVPHALKCSFEPTRTLASRQYVTKQLAYRLPKVEASQHSSGNAILSRQFLEGSAFKLPRSAGCDATHPNRGRHTLSRSVKLGVTRAASAVTSGRPGDVSTPEQQQALKQLEAILATVPNLPTGPGSKNDDETRAWFLWDRKYDPVEAAEKLAKYLTWRRDFGVDKLTAEMVAAEAATGKAYIHTSRDRQGRPVIVVNAAKHVPSQTSLQDSSRLCVYLIEQVLATLKQEGRDQFLGVFDLRGFQSSNTDLEFMKFLIDVFFNYYPKRLGQVLFVDAPFIFQPGWALMKPLLKSYANLVYFCNRNSYSDYFEPGKEPKAP